MVIAFAGRRIDAPNATVARFPCGNTRLVRQRIRAQFERVAAAIMVSSAACGADLLALDVAAELAMRRVVVLPWERGRFRETSVIDRGIEWGRTFDRVIDDVARSGDLRIVGATGNGNEPFLVTNEAILDTAGELARARGQPGVPAELIALVAWNRQPRAVSDDVTEGFVGAARRRRMAVIEIATL
jgi:hypothetical protein